MLLTKAQISPLPSKLQKQRNHDQRPQEMKISMRGGFLCGDNPCTHSSQASLFLGIRPCKLQPNLMDSQGSVGGQAIWLEAVFMHGLWVWWCYWNMPLWTPYGPIWHQDSWEQALGEKIIQCKVILPFIEKFWRELVGIMFPFCLCLCSPSPSSLHSFPTYVSQTHVEGRMIALCYHLISLSGDK